MAICHLAAVERLAVLKNSKGTGMRRTVAFCTLSLLVFWDPLVAEELRPFQRTDVFDLEWVSDPQISPDGRKVVGVLMPLVQR